MLFPAFTSMPHFYCLVESPVKSICVAGPWFAVKGKAEQNQDLRADAVGSVALARRSCCSVISSTGAESPAR